MYGILTIIVNRRHFYHLDMNVCNGRLTLCVHSSADLFLYSIKCIRTINIFLIILSYFICQMINKDTRQYFELDIYTTQDMNRKIQGRIQGGGDPPFWGRPNFIKRELKLRGCAPISHVSVLNSYPDPPPPFPKSCIRPRNNIFHSCNNYYKTEHMTLCL